MSSSNFKSLSYKDKSGRMKRNGELKIKDEMNYIFNSKFVIIKWPASRVSRSIHNGTLKNDNIFLVFFCSNINYLNCGLL